MTADVNKPLEMQFPNFDRFANAANSASSLDFYDDTLKVVDRTDATKRVRIDAGNLTASTDVTLTAYDSGLLAGGRENVLASSGNLTLTAAMSGRTMLFDAAGATAYVLPAITAAEVGVWYRFFTTVTATGNHTITAAAADLLVGQAWMGVTGADIEVFAPDVTDDLIITMNGTTTGGIAGSTVYVVALSATRWGVLAHMRCSGAQATPFS